MKTSAVDIGQYSTMNIAIFLDRQRLSMPVSRMDISAVLNPSEELAPEAELMAVDSPTPHFSHNHSTRESSGTVEGSEGSSPTAVRGKSQSDNSLPPIRMFLQNISPSPLLKDDSPDYCTQMGMLEVQKNAWLKCRLPRIHHARSTDGIVRNYNEYQTQSLIVEEETCISVSRRRSHHSPRSPRSPHHHILRRESHPQSVWSIPIRQAQGDGRRYRQPIIIAEDIDTHYDSSTSPVSKPRASSTHNNKPYSIEMIDWIRYHRVDRGMAFKSDMMPLFFEQFPERYDANATEQMLSSRYYRDNSRPFLDAGGNRVLDSKGNLKVVSARVRDRGTAEGKELDFPSSLVDKWPARLLCEKYRLWKSPIREEDRERARQILAGNDVNDPLGSKSFLMIDGLNAY
jgi:hypothetical protein